MQLVYGVNLDKCSHQTSLHMVKSGVAKCSLLHHPVVKNHKECVQAAEKGTELSPVA